MGSHSIEEMVALGAGKPRTNVQNATNQVGEGGGAHRGESSVEQLKKIASTLTRNASQEVSEEIHHLLSQCSHFFPVRYFCPPL